VIVKQTATYTLAARTAASWTIHVSLRREAASQRVTADAQVIGIFRLLEGDLELSPARPLGTGTLSVESRVHARVGAIDQLSEDTGELQLR
jgi:hypothetical protein